MRIYEYTSDFYQQLNEKISRNLQEKALQPLKIENVMIDTSFEMCSIETLSKGVGKT